LARFGDTLFERQSKDQMQAGAQKARDTVQSLDESRTTYADAVRQGRIPAHLNPWMKQGYYEELGRMYGDRLNADLTAAVETDANLQNSVEMSDFRKFTSDFEKNWLDSNVPLDQRNSAFQVGYGNRRDAHIANLEAGWSAQTEERFTKRTLAMFRDEAVGFMQDALDKGQSPDQIGKTLKQMLDDKHALGWDSRLTGTTLVDAISDIALEHRDSDLMKTLLKSIPKGPGEPDRSYAIRATNDASEAIFKARTQDREQQDADRKTAIRGLEATAVGRFLDAKKNGTAPRDVDVSDLQQQAIRLGAGDVADHIGTVKDAYQNNEYTNDPNLLAGFLNKLHQGPYVLTKGELRTALKDKNLSLETYNSLNNALETAQREAEDRRRAGRPFLADDPDRNAGIAAIDRMFAASSPDEDLPMVRFRAERAREQFDSWYSHTYSGEGEAPSKPLSPQRKTEVEGMVNSIFKSSYPVDDSFSGTFRLSGADLNWKSRPVDTPDRLDPALTELALVINGKAKPSPYLVSLLQVFGVDLGSKEEMAKFLGAQRSFVPMKEKKTSGARP
jgi:hypothetical protein